MGVKKSIIRRNIPLAVIKTVNTEQKSFSFSETVNNQNPYNVTFTERKIRNKFYCLVEYAFNEALCKSLLLVEQYLSLDRNR